MTIEGLPLPALVAGLVGALAVLALAIAALRRVAHGAGRARPARPSTYLVGHIVTFPPLTTADVLARVVAENAAGRVRSGLIAGFTAGPWGGVDGLVTIEILGDGAAAMAVWSAYRPTPNGVANVTLLLGADAETFAHLEPVALAVLASARFD